MKMQRKKRGIYIIYITIFSMFIMLLTSTVSAGFFDWLKKTTTGSPIGPQEQNMTITVTGTDPAEIIYVNVPPTIPNENSFIPIVFNIIMYDPNGVNDLNHTSVSANFSYGGATRENNSCTRIPGEDTTFTANYSCTINMWYWDTDAYWNVGVRGKDMGNGTWQYNTSAILNYGELRAIVISPVILEWPAVGAGEINVIPTNQPTVINNTGNYDGEVSVNAIDLLGGPDPSEKVAAENFSIDISSGCGGTTLINGTSVAIADSNSNPGNLSGGGGAGQEELYYCIPQFPMVPSQDYTTEQGGSWLIEY